MSACVYIHMPYIHACPVDMNQQPVPSNRVYVAPLKPVLCYCPPAQASSPIAIIENEYSMKNAPP